MLHKLLCVLRLRRVLRQKDEVQLRLLLNHATRQLRIQLLTGSQRQLEYARSFLLSANPEHLRAADGACALHGLPSALHCHFLRVLHLSLLLTLNAICFYHSLTRLIERLLFKRLRYTSAAIALKRAFQVSEEKRRWKLIHHAIPALET